MRRVPDLTKAYNLLAYKPKVNMKEAIKKVIEHRKVEIEFKRQEDMKLSKNYNESYKDSPVFAN